jgi:cytochrome oxidase Cu insertion factor (SCO1/SenC/PrrC family)
MRRVTTTLLTAVLMLSIIVILPVSIIAADDPFVASGFIKTKKSAPAFDIALKDINGSQVKLSDYRGKVVMLFFWTTW